MQTGGPASGVNPEDQSYGASNTTREEDRAEGNREDVRGEKLLRNECDKERKQHPRHDADQSSDERQERRLDEELQQNVFAASADRFAQSDLSRPLRHRDEHDIHNADPSDDKRDGRDEREEDGK